MRAPGWALVLVLMGLGVAARAQGPDAALRDRVGQLVGRLAAPKAEDREAAEKALVALGPRALTLLPEAGTIKDAEQKQRLERVRQALIEAQDKAALTPTRVTIRGQGIRLSEAVQQLQRQTGNPLTDLREQYGEEATNPALDLDIVEKPFFEALDIVCRAAGLTPEFFTGDGTLGLMAGMGEMAEQPQPAASAPNPRVVYTGPFRVELKQLAASRDFATGIASANAQFEIAWEPRLRPMLLALKSEDVEIIDDRGTAVAPQVPEEESSVVLRPESPAAEVNLNMAAPERAAQKLAKLRVKAEMTAPAGLKTFRIPDLTKPTKQALGDVSLELVSTEVDEHVWKVRVTLVYPGEGPAFETYRQGLFNNRIWLQKADGSRFEHNGGFNSLGMDGGRLGFEYLFVDAPGKPSDYSLVYETPSRVETLPIEFEFKDVELP